MANVSLLRKQRATGYPILFLVNMTGYQRPTIPNRGLPMIVARLYFFLSPVQYSTAKQKKFYLKIFKVFQTSWNIKDFKKIYERATKDE